MNQLQNVFDYNGRQVRTVIGENGEPWFVAKDVCEVFGDTNYRRSVARLDEDEKGVSPFNTPGGMQNLGIVNEAGLYSILWNMQPQKKPSMTDEEFTQRVDGLKKFKRWVTHEVLPSIRKHGMYATDELLNNPDLLIQVATKLKEERELRLAAESKNQILEQLVTEYEPKVTYVDHILRSQDAVAVTQIASDYGISAKKLNKVLHDEGVQYKVNGQWVLYRDHQGNGYTKSRTHDYTRTDGTTGVKLDTRWTQKGRLFIHDILTRLGFVPEIERVLEVL